MTGFAAPQITFFYQGQVAASGSVYVYQTLTTTLVTVYSDSGLTTPITNPINLDANGQAKFFVSGTVNLRLDAYTGLAGAGTLIESLDPVFPTGGGSVNVATSTTVPPSGRLTLTTATPVLTSTVSAATTTYFTPYLGNQIPVWSGTLFGMTTFGEMSQLLTDATKSPAAAAVSSLYDMFVWLDGVTLRCTRGPAWTNSTTRGTGAGTTQISLVQGYYSNTVAITNGPAAGYGTYVGTIATNAGGTVDFILGAKANGGTAGVIGLWNYFNRVVYTAQVQDNTASWSYALIAWRAANASNTNRVTYVAGLAEENIQATYTIQVRPQNVNGAEIGIGIGQDTVTNYTGVAAFSESNSTLTTMNPSFSAIADVNSGLGQHYIQAVEYTNSTAANGTLYGMDAGGSTLSIQTMNLLVRSKF
jgi:hypothetical protein